MNLKRKVIGAKPVKIPPPFQEKPLHPLVYVNLYPIDGVYVRYALVVVEISDKTVTVLGPMQGERVLMMETFRSAWRIQRNLTILILR